MQKLLKPIILLGAFIFVAVLVFSYVRRQREDAPDTPIVGDCPITQERVSVKGPWLEPRAKEGDDLTVDLGYYGCHPVKRGEWAYYRYSQKREPVIKQVEAVAGDRFDIEPREGDQPGWHLLVNGERVKRGDQDYFFGRKSEPAISLYIKSREGVLREGEVILLSLKPPGREDSGMFGIMSIEDLIGRVRKPKRTDPSE